MNSKELGDELYECALNLFENKLYDEAMNCFVKLYDMGMYRDEVISIIYDCFVNLNLDEFKNNYLSIDELLFPIPYEQLTLDFIPVSEQKFYIYDREKAAFAGSIDLEEMLSVEKKDVEEVDSLFISDVWDIRDVWNLMFQKNWSTVYWLVEKDIARFYSFFKIKEVAEEFKSVVIFRSKEIMKIFFEENSDIYLPKIYASENNERYNNFFTEIHKDRIHNTEAKRDNILLSICIPSFQRGEYAWKSVSEILKCQYDSEIEIVVSNNGSDNSEYYDRIKELKDSRITYFEFEENQGFASNANKVLELANGMFAMLASDEDILILENLPDFLKYLINNMNVGVISVSGNHGNMIQRDEAEYEQGLSSIVKGVNCNYITGICYNSQAMKKLNILEIVKKNRGNYFLELYVHCVIAALMGIYMNTKECSIVLWNCGNETQEEQEKLHEYMTLESRIEQFVSCMNFLKQFVEDKQILLYLLKERSRKTFFLLFLAYIEKHSHFKMDWKVICHKLYQDIIRYSEKLFDDKRLLDNMQEYLVQLYLGWISCEKVPENKLVENQIFMLLTTNGVQKGKEIQNMDIELINKKVKYLLDMM